MASMFLSFLSLISILALQTTAGPVRKAARPEHGWQRKFLAPRDGSMKLHIALRQDDGGCKAVDQLLAISDPYGPSFRKYLGAEQAAYLSTPAHGTVHDIEFWLWKHDLLKESSLFGGIYEIDTTIRRAERLLNTTYFVWSDGEQEVVRTELFYLPDNVAGHIDFVAPTTSFPKSKTVYTSARGSTGTTAQRALQAQVLNERATCGANSFVTPTCIRQAYQIDYEAQPNRTTFAVYATEAASYSSGDLHTFISRNNLLAAEAGASYEVIGSGDPSESSSVEAKFETALDTQTLLGLAWPAKGILYNKGGVFGPKPGSTYDPFVQFLQELIANKTIPSVVSFSESMPEDMMDPAYAKRLCNMMAQVGARGVTLLFSSGDNGPNGDQPSGKHNKIFEPEFPASCPWVTAVGGTTNLADETAATKSTINIVGRSGYTASGGGFSNLFTAPGYQESVVSTYVSKHVPSSYHSIDGFNPTGRGIPDVSAFSTNLPTVVDFITFPIGGTSASTPLWAAIVTLLNDYEASKGRKPLGFINPWLYTLKSGLKDIATGGNNAGSCDVLAGCDLPETLGYNTTVGWDASTGLGSPIFAELTKALDTLAERP